MRVHFCSQRHLGLSLERPIGDSLQIRLEPTETVSPSKSHRNRKESPLATLSSRCWLRKSQRQGFPALVQSLASHSLQRSKRSDEATVSRGVSFRCATAMSSLFPHHAVPTSAGRGVSVSLSHILKAICFGLAVRGRC